MRRLVACMLALLFVVGCRLDVADLAEILDRLEQDPLYTAPDFNEFAVRDSVTATELIPLFVAFAASRNVPVSFVDLQSHRPGLWGLTNVMGFGILVEESLGSEAKLAALVHELGHVCHHYKGKGVSGRASESEVIAESIGILVLQDVKGLDETFRIGAAYLLNTASSGIRRTVYRQHAEVIRYCVAEMRTALPVMQSKYSKRQPNA